ncbi:MAG: hypothetical protein Q7U31_06610, partial [Anaerolineaceae bacterium]|nr:hypothetical protein [Anaerolineaceae bacterium]
LPVLAKCTVEVAAQHAEGQHLAAGQKVAEGFFLNGVHLRACHISAGDHEDAVRVETDGAQSALVGVDQAAVRTGLTTEVMVVEAFEKAAGLGKFVEREGGIHCIHYS